MTYFFYNDNFYHDLQQFVEYEEIDEETFSEFPDDWEMRVELADLEPIFEIDADRLCELLAEANEDRLSENFDEEQKVLKALKECIDFDKLKEALPKLYYPNNKFETITKADLLEFI